MKTIIPKQKVNTNQTILSASNAKIQKGIHLGFNPRILHFAPNDISGVNVCPYASESCSEDCLHQNGNGRFDSTLYARINKTLYYFYYKNLFEDNLELEIRKLIVQSDKLGVRPALRLNGTSDIPALAIKFAKKFSDVQFYDYTAIFDTLFRKDLPKNYDLTFSRKENNHLRTLEARKMGFKTAWVVDEYRNEFIIPETGELIKTIDGDEHDFTFLRPEASVLFLKAKGKMRRETRGMVWRFKPLPIRKIQKQIKKRVYNFDVEMILN